MIRCPTSGHLPITHVLFDLDDLLIDSERLFDVAIDTILEPFGLSLSFQDKEALMGKTSVEMIHFLHDQFDLSVSEDDLVTRYCDLRPHILENLSLMEGAFYLVNLLWCLDIPMAVATGSCDESFALKIKDYPGLFSKMSHAVCSGSDKAVKKTKPAPDIFIEAAQRFHRQPISPRNVLVFEDAANGIKGALAANMRAVWIPDQRADRTLFQNHPDVTILNSLEEFCPDTFLMPYKDKFHLI